MSYFYRYRGVILHAATVLAYLPFTVAFITLASATVTDFISEPVYSTFRTRHQEVSFPGFTMCVWPPFQPGRLKDIGVDYNFSKHCSDVVVAPIKTIRLVVIHINKERTGGHSRFIYE